MGKRILNEALRKIVNAERRGKATADLQPVSNMMASFLRIMKNRGYIKDFQVTDMQRVGKITVELQGRVNDCRAIMYRQDLRAKEIDEYKIRTLPTRQWGYVVISTPNGVLDHEEAKRLNVGGYIKDFQVTDMQRVGKITVELQGRVNDCRAIMHRQDLRAKEIDEYKIRTLPTRQWDYVVISTPNGVLDHEEAKRLYVGGQVLGYFL